MNRKLKSTLEHKMTKEQQKQDDTLMLRLRKNLVLFRKAEDRRKRRFNEQCRNKFQHPWQRKMRGVEVMQKAFSQTEKAAKKFSNNLLKKGFSK